MGSEIYKEAWEAAGGKTPEHWQFVSIESLLESSKSISVGVMYPGTNTLEGIPLIRVADVKDGKVSKKPDFTISKDVHNEYKRTELNGSELLITLVGNPGDCVIATPEMTGWNVARALAVLRLNNPEIRSWLRYVLLSAPAKHLIDSRLNTTVQKTLNLKDIKELGLPIAPDKERNSITSIVESIENKIELNRQMNATLEAMAQALFKSWFVDFDPVIDNALAAGNPIPDELQAKAAARLALGDARKPLPAEIQALFPSAFLLSEEMGWIPEGWEVCDFSKIAFINSESWSNKNTPKFVNYVDLSNAKNGRISEVINYDFESAPSRARRILRQDDTIIGLVRPANKSFAYIFETGLTGSTGFAVMRPKCDFYRTFIYLSLTQQETIDYFAHIADGGAYPAIRPEVVTNHLITKPNNTKVIEAFDKLVYPFFKKIGLNEQASKVCSEKRDLLLPKLLSGELRIPEAETYPNNK